MYQKRGQITVFLILGVVLVFIVVAVIMLSVTIQKKTLERKHQEIAQRLLQKEALRIYVDEELPDIIDDFLITFGKQGGKVYDDQGGSARRDVPVDNPPEVVSPPTGIEYAVEGETLHVGYGIRYEKDVEYAENNPEWNKYPCAPCLIEHCGSGGDPPRFCQYRYPQRRGSDGNIVRFGRLELPRLTEVERQLAQYLQKRLVGFIQEFIVQKIRLDVQVIPSAEEPEIDVFFESERVRVTVKYPLILRYQGEDIAALADFSFTEETQFKKYYDAVRELFQYDVEYMDFQLTPEAVEGYRQDTFRFPLQYDGGTIPSYCSPDVDERGWHTCELTTKYNFVPDMEMEQPRFDVNDAGDDVFVFHVPAGGVVRDRSYTFVVARQNRPPVVDYISYLPGKDFDYLIVPGERGELVLTLTSEARDPDHLGDFEGELSIKKLTPQLGGTIVENDVNGVDPIVLNREDDLKITATDEFGGSDIQIIRICSDPVISVGIYQEISQGLPVGEVPPMGLLQSASPDQLTQEMYCGCSADHNGFHCSAPRSNGFLNGVCQEGTCLLPVNPPNS